MSKLKSEPVALLTMLFAIAAGAVQFYPWLAHRPWYGLAVFAGTIITGGAVRSQVTPVTPSGLVPGPGPDFGGE